MNKDGSISPQEKEKLRKRLQKLFQKERYNNGESFSSEGKSSKTSKQDKGSQMKGGKKLQFKTGKVKKPHSGTSSSPKNSNKQKQQNQKQTSPEEKNTTTIKQNGFAKSNRKKDSTYISPNKQKNVKQSKQNGFVESSIETKETNMQQNSIDKTTKNEKSQTKNSPSKQHSMKQKTNSNENKKKTKQNGFVEIPIKTDETKKGQKVINKTAVKSNEKLQKTKVSTSPSKQLNENKKTNSNTPQKPTSREENVTKKQTNFNKQNEQKSSQPTNKTQQQKKSQEIKKKQSDEKVTNKTTTKLNNSASNKQTHHHNKNQNKPPQKRTAPPPEETSSHHTAVPITNKKPKLSHQTNNKKDNSMKANRKNNKKNDKNNFDFKANKDEHNEFDLNNMTGCVRGGDFDSDYEEHPQEHKYWMQQHQNSKSVDESGEDSQLEEEQHNKSASTSSPKNNRSGEKSKKNIITDLQQYNKNNDSSNSESDDYSDDEEHEFDDSYFFGDTDEYDDEEEELEEEENYSDYDENDYEEDEDSYDYSDDDDDEFSSNYDEEEDDEYGNDGSYDFNDSDEDDDYELPKDVPEDLVIHRGTATKRDLKPEDNISFDSENEEAQIIELEHQDTVKVIEQPKNYDKEELLKLKYQENSNTPKPITFHRKEQVNINSNDKTLTTTQTPTSTSNNETEDDCPKLVPIIDEDGFQLYNPNEDESQYEQDMVEEYDENEEEQSYEEYDDDDENMDEISLGSEYEEINSDDADSIISEDINEKYLCKTQIEYNSDVESIDEEIWQRKHKADIIDATACKYEKYKDKKKIDKDLEVNDDIKQLPSMKLFDKVNLKTASSILSTTIIDKKHFKINDSTKDTQGEKENLSKAETKNNKALKDKETLEEKTLADVMVNETVNDNIAQPLNVSTTSQQEVVMERMEVTEELENATDQARIVKPITHNFSDYQTKFFNALDSNLVLVLLKDPFYIYGTVRLTLLAGCLEVYGHALQLNQEVELFSPRGCSVIEISPSTNERSQGNLKDILKSYEKHFALADLKTINDNFNAQTNAVVLLKRNESRKKLVQQFKKFMNENVFPNLNNINTDRPLYNSEYLLRCMINTSQQEEKSLKLPKQWQNLQVKNVSRIMLAGGKSVGKSTLIRYLINRHLPLQKKILLIDLDIGQPEIFIPQTVSCTLITQPLLGPGFMLNLQPEIAFAVGHTNIALCPHKYLNAVRNLIAYCKSQQEFAEIPWFINTMGYNKGFGLELIAAIAQELPLTDLIQLQSNKDINNFDSILHAHVLNKIPSLMFALESKDIIETLKYRLHVWQSAVEQESRYQKEWEMSAKDMRFAMLLTRLSDALQGHAEWLTDIKPLSASLNDLKIVNLLDNTPQLSTEELAKALEANLVYLCHYQDDNEPLKCLGIGVVRAVDHHIQQVYLIPAVHNSLLKDVNCLALGEMPLPTSLFTNQGSKVKNIAPFVYNTVADNASKAIKQIYHRPRKFLSGKHKTLD